MCYLVGWKYALITLPFHSAKGGSINPNHIAFPDYSDWNYLELISFSASL